MKTGPLLLSSSYASLLYWSVPNKSMSTYTKEVADVLLNVFDKGAHKILYR